MATTGQVNTNITYDSYFWVYWNQISQDVATNTTRIYWSCGVYCGHSFYLNAIKMSAVTINGVQVYGGGTYSNYSRGDHGIASGQLDITHNDDGTMTFSIGAFTGWLYEKNDYSSNGESYALTAIPRAATLISAPDFTDQDNPKITYSNPAGDAVTALDACISFTGAADNINYRSIIKTGTEYTFPLTTAERDLLRNNTPGTQRDVCFSVRTTIGDKLYYSTVWKTFYVLDSEATKPSVSVAVTLNNGTLPSKFAGLYIQGKSKVDVKLSATGKYGATVNRYAATMDGKEYNKDSFTTDVVKKAGIVEIVGYAADTRDFVGVALARISVIEYAKPSVVPVGSENAILCYRSDGNGKRVGASTSIWIKAKRSYYSVSGKNTCVLQWRWKNSTEQWNDSNHLWRNLLSNSDTANEYNALITGVEFALKNSYSIQIRAVDDIGEQDIKTLEVPTQDVALHLGRGGKNVSVGSYCDYSEDYTFHSEWKAIFDEDVVIAGDILLGDSKTTLREYIINVINGGG